MIIRNTFVGEMLNKPKPITVLQVFCKIILNFKDIVKSIKGPDDNF